MGTDERDKETIEMDWERGWAEWCKRDRARPAEDAAEPRKPLWDLMGTIEGMRTLPTDELVYRLVALSGSMSHSVGTYEMGEHQRLLVALDERGLSDQDKESIGALIRPVEAKWKRLEPS